MKPNNISDLLITNFNLIGGALIGNLLFGFLIDFNCHVPVIVFSSMLFSELIDV